MLFLDEPTIGLDVNAKRNIRHFLKLINEQFGKTILLTTHDMDDIEQLCNRVMVINNGELSYDGTVKSLRDTIGAYRDYRHFPRSFCNSRGIFRRRGFYRPDSVTSTLDNTVTIEVNRREMNTLDIFKELGRWGELDDIDMEDPDFEDVIHKVY